MSKQYFIEAETSITCVKSFTEKIIHNGSSALGFQYFWFRDYRVVYDEPITNLDEMVRILIENPSSHEEETPISHWTAWYAGELFYINVVHEATNSALPFSFSPFAYSWRRAHVGEQYFHDAHKYLSAFMRLCKDIPLTYVNLIQI